MVMNKEQQIKNLKKLANTYKVDWDLIDFDHLIDDTLEYEENKVVLMDIIEGLSSSKNFVEKIEADKKVKIINITDENKEIEKVELDNLKKEAENSEKEFNKSLKNIENNSEIIKQIYAIPHEYTKIVADDNNEIKAVLFTGKAGVSKSYGTLQVLNELKIDYVYHSGFTTPLALYEFLYKNNQRGKIVVFDDSCGLINTQQATSIMLNALYSSTGKRKIMWNSTKKGKGLPDEFIFEANIILITNALPKTLSTDLINSRCLSYEFKFSNFEVLAIMKAIAQTKHKKLKKEERNIVVNFIKLNIDETTENFDLRVQEKIENLYLYSKKKWKDLALPLLNSKNQKMVLLKHYLKESSNLTEAIKSWCQETGLTERQFYRYKKLYNYNKSTDILTLNTK